MRALFKLTILLLFSQTLAAQTSQNNDFLGKISLGIRADDQKENLTETQKAKIETKIIGLVSRYGISGTTTSNTNFVISTRLEVYGEKVVEGMQNIHVINGEINLFIKQASSNIVFSSYNKKIQGSGQNRNDALTNLIGAIDTYDPELKIFIENGKQKILDFYNSKCNDIILEAERYAGMNNFEHALTILMSVPIEATPCYEKIKDKSIEVFKKYQSKNCMSQIQLAKSQIAGNNFLYALNTLSMIDPTSSCSKEVNSLIISAESKLDDQEKTEWNRKREAQKDKIELQKMQIQASKEISLGYLNRKSSSPFSILDFLF